MGRFDAPPPMVSREELARRRAAGAKTFKELDPEYWEFHQREMRELRVKWTILGVVIWGCILALIIAKVVISLRHIAVG